MRTALGLSRRAMLALTFCSVCRRKSSSPFPIIFSVAVPPIFSRVSRQEFLFAPGSGCPQQGQQFGFLLRAGADFGQRGHRVAPYLLAGIMQQAPQPAPHRVLVFRRPRFGKTTPTARMTAALCDSFLGRGPVKARRLPVPERVPRQNAQLGGRVPWLCFSSDNKVTQTVQAPGSSVAAAPAIGRSKNSRHATSIDAAAMMTAWVAGSFRSSIQLFIITPILPKLISMFRSSVL